MQINKRTKNVKNLTKTFNQSFKKTISPRISTLRRHTVGSIICILFGKNAIKKSLLLWKPERVYPTKLCQI